MLAEKLEQAILERNAEKVRELIESGVEVNPRTQSLMPLHLAVRTRDNRIVEILLKNGADVNAGAHDGSTALHLAANHMTDEIVKTLISFGANTEARDKYGNTPLHVAANIGRTQPIKALLAGGADPNARDTCGATPADVAPPRIRVLLPLPDPQGNQAGHDGQNGRESGRGEESRRRTPHSR